MMTTNEFVISQALEDKIIEPSNFISVKDLSETDIPCLPGIYIIQIKEIKKLPLSFRKVLLERKHNILYIGITKGSLRKRLWKNELHSQNGHGSFFRSLGAILGYLPKAGSLSTKRNKYNYKFSSTDNGEIISWVENNLQINFIVHNDNLVQIERYLIAKYLPLLNVDKNPAALEELKQLRQKCRDIANGL